MAKKFVKTLPVNTDRYNEIQRELEAFNTQSLPLLKYLHLFNPAQYPQSYWLQFWTALPSDRYNKLYRAVVTAAHVKAANYPGTVIDMEAEIDKMWQYVNENFTCHIAGAGLTAEVCHWDEESGKFVYNDGCIQLTEDWYLEDKDEQEVWEALVQLDSILKKVNLRKYTGGFYPFVAGDSTFVKEMTPGVFAAIMADTKFYNENKK